jgi:PII-like signaling protein
MKLPAEAKLLRIFIGEADKFEGKPLYEAIVNLAREKGMAGATVLRGLMGFGADSKMHTAKILRLSEDLPMVIEIVDKPEKIEALLPELDKMIEEGMVTFERVDVIAYRKDDQQS